MNGSVAYAMEINIISDKVVASRDGSSLTYIGNVVAKFQNFNILTDKMTAQFKDNSDSGSHELLSIAVPGVAKIARINSSEDNNVLIMKSVIYDHIKCLLRSNHEVYSLYNGVVVSAGKLDVLSICK